MDFKLAFPEEENILFKLGPEISKKIILYEIIEIDLGDDSKKNKKARRESEITFLSSQDQNEVVDEVDNCD